MAIYCGLTPLVCTGGRAQARRAVTPMNTTNLSTTLPSPPCLQSVLKVQKRRGIRRTFSKGISMEKLLRQLLSVLSLPQESSRSHHLCLQPLCQILHQNGPKGGDGSLQKPLWLDSKVKQRYSWVFKHMPHDDMYTLYYNDDGEEVWRC